MKDIVSWVELGATLALLGVTFWYAKTTRNMAISARDSAHESARATIAAERSAEAARDAATIAQSQVQPEFHGRMVAMTNGEDRDDYEACIEIRSVGDAVVVNRVVIRRAFRLSYDHTGQIAIADAELTPTGMDSNLPRRLHRGERLLLTHDSLQHADKDPFERFIIDVEYSFVEGGEAGGVKQLVINEF